MRRERDKGQILTHDQHRYWIDNGYLVLNAAVPDVGIWLDLLAGPVTKAGPCLLERLYRSGLIDLAAAILDDEVSIVSSRVVSRALDTPFCRDSWRLPMLDVNHSLVCAVYLDPAGPETGSERLFAGTHHASRYRVDQSKTRPVDELGDLSTWVSRHKLRPENAVLRPGDVWLRHPLLLHGSITGESCVQASRRLEITFVTRSHLPKLDLPEWAQGASTTRMRCPSPVVDERPTKA